MVDGGHGFSVEMIIIGAAVAVAVELVIVTAMLVGVTEAVWTFVDVEEDVTPIVEVFVGVEVFVSIITIGSLDCVLSPRLLKIAPPRSPMDRITTPISMSNQIGSLLLR